MKNVIWIGVSRTYIKAFPRIEFLLVTLVSKNIYLEENVHILAENQPDVSIDVVFKTVIVRFGKSLPTL